MESSSSVGMTRALMRDPGAEMSLSTPTAALFFDSSTEMPMFCECEGTEQESGRRVGGRAGGGQRQIASKKRG